MALKASVIMGPGYLEEITLSNYDNGSNSTETAFLRHIILANTK